MKPGNEIKFNSKNKADIQAYLDYINIVGNDDNGKLMSEKEFEDYKKNMKNKKRDHLYVYWINSTGFECKVIGPESMCFCNHRYKYHDYNNTNNKKIKCKKCQCKCYEHVPCYGANDVKCLCHHSYREHDLFSRTCNRRNCKCQKFNSKFTCNCGEGYDTHKTVIYTREERIKDGKPVEVGWFGDSLMNSGGNIPLGNYGEMMNDIYDTEFKNMERKPDGKKIMYRNGVAINSNLNKRKDNALSNYNNNNNGPLNFNNNENDNYNYFNNNRCKSNDNFSKLKKMTYEEAFGLNKKPKIKNDFETGNNNMKKYGGLIMGNKNYSYNNDTKNKYNDNQYFNNNYKINKNYNMNFQEKDKYLSYNNNNINENKFSYNNNFNNNDYNYNYNNNQYNYKSSNCNYNQYSNINNEIKYL